MRKTSDEAARTGSDLARQNDGNCLGCIHGSHDRSHGSPAVTHDINFKTNKLSRKLSSLFDFAVHKSLLNHYVLSFNVTKLA